jgi:hypothetical protein
MQMVYTSLCGITPTVMATKYDRLYNVMQREKNYPAMGVTKWKFGQVSLQPTSCSVNSLRQDIGSLLKIGFMSFPLNVKLTFFEVY